MPEIRTILHPTDFSESSEAARRLACAFARDFGARLVLVHVYPPPPTGGEVADRGWAAATRDDVLARLQDLVLDDRTITIEYRAVEGRPAEVIARVAAEEGCDLIVMGTHGWGSLARALMGSVAEGVARHAPCPVATIRPAVPALRESTEQWPGAIEDIEIGAGD